MAQQIPFSTDARQTFRTTLGGQNVRFAAWWQPLDEYWYFSLHWLDRRPIITGARLVQAGEPMNGLVTEFKGGFRVDGAGRPGRNGFTETHRLLYLAPGEVYG